MGGDERIADQRARGKLTVRERIAGLLDADSFRERGELAGAGAYDEQGTLVDFFPASYVMGIGLIDGRRVVVGGGDLTARPASGSLGVRMYSGRSAAKGGSDEQMALDLKLPMIRLIDGFGADIRAVARLNRTYIPAMSWALTARLLSEVPLVSVALGSVAGGPAALAAAAHWSVMVKDLSQVFAAGPPVVARALGQQITKEELGGYQVHARGSGVIDNEAEDEQDALRQVRAFLSYLPGNVYTLPPICATDDPPDRREQALLSLIPRDRNRPYNPRRMVELIVDRGSAFEIGRYYGRSQLTLFARINGYPVGVLANDPAVHGGAMDADAAQKLEKFVDLCDTFHLPVVNFADQPGFMIGLAAESAGTLKQGVRAAIAMEAASVPWATVIVRRLYGVAGAAHQAHEHFNFRIAWPSGEWGSLPIEGGVAAAYRREIEAADDPDAHRARLEEDMISVRSPFHTAEAVDIEDIIDPRDTRPMLAEWVELAYHKLPVTLGRRLRPMRP
jgi:acetyl-CoA carboxylase carboxyltransferase component